MSAPPPEVIALVLADQVYRDEDSGKLFVLGVRSRIGAASFPLSHGHLVVYVALVNGRGAAAIGIRLIDADEEDEPLAEQEVIIEFPSPLDEVQVIFDLHNLTFPTHGDYRLQLLCDGHFLRERILVVFPKEA